MPRALPRKKQKAAIRSRSTERLRRIFLSRPQNLEVQMKSCFSRAATAIGIGASLWFGNIAALATPQQPQPQTKDQTTAQTQSTSSQTDQKNKNSGTPVPQQIAANKKPLSTNEDPAMIGKRNINKGIWGKMAAGTEKEVREGRMLAAQVDKEAKFIDDPIITEYVNRVGQNIVLHSDAKVPFTIKVIDSDEVNAFALPGGFFYVNKGLILAADNKKNPPGSANAFTISTGQAVRWTNRDPVEHTVTFDGAAEPGSPVIPPNGSYVHRFDKPGTYTYHCTPHPFMKGVVVVK